MRGSKPVPRTLMRALVALRFLTGFANNVTDPLFVILVGIAMAPSEEGNAGRIIAAHMREAIATLWNP